MTTIEQKTLVRRSDADESAGPPILRVGVYYLGGECPENCYELRGEDERGRLHFAFRDPRRVAVLQEYGMTLNELGNQYLPLEAAPA